MTAATRYETIAQNAGPNNTLGYFHDGRGVIRRLRYILVPVGASDLTVKLQTGQPFPLSPLADLVSPIVDPGDTPVTGVVDGPLGSFVVNITGTTGTVSVLAIMEIGY